MEKLLKSNSERYVILALAGWFVLNLLQGIFTELLHDEAYYWVYSRSLSFAYFDHLPAVAYWIRAGSSLLPGEIGVRLLTVLSSPFILYTIYKLSEVSNVRWFMLFAFSLFVVHVGGFLSTPDSPLILSVVVFLLAYRFWLKKLDFKSSVILGLAGSFVCISKYQGILFVILLLLLNLDKWKTVALWIPPITTAILLLPIYVFNSQIFSQALDFHSIGHIAKQHPLELCGSFLLSQLLLLGPIVFPFIIIALIRFRSDSYFFTSLRRASLLYLGILFFMSFRYTVEANWSAPVVPAILVISIRYWSERPAAWKTGKFALVLSLILMLIARTYLLWDFLPSEMSRKLSQDFHRWKNWAMQVENLCGKDPVVFSNSYQRAAKYWYYSGNQSTSANNSMYRKNQFSLMNMESDWQGKTVWFAYPYRRVAGVDSVVDPNGGVLYFERYSQFYSYYDVSINLINDDIRFSAGDTTMVMFEIVTATGLEKKLIAEKEGLIYIGYWWQNEDGKYSSFTDTSNWNGTIIPGDGLRHSLPIVTPDVKGEYRFCPYFVVDHYGFSMNAKPLRLIVE